MELDTVRLQEENRRLSELVERDWLTGLYNRGATEEQIDRRLKEQKCGILLFLDVDHFKQVNDRYGHIAGDRLLCEVGKTLRYMASRNDIVGRVGGDEFVMYLPEHGDKRYLEERRSRIQSRMAGITLPDATVHITVTVGGALYQDGDNYRSLFDRADQRLMRLKRGRSKSASVPETGPEGIETDVGQIREDLAEGDPVAGAFCQDYDTFRNIFRYAERRLRRLERSAYVILLTLTDREGGFPPLQEREEQMGLLKEIIQSSLRLGDVFTQYTSCQFLVMVSDLSAEDAERISERISGVFFERTSVKPESLLLHHCFPLRPAG